MFYPNVLVVLIVWVW